ncbi:MAG: molybdopterin cofactor-binding domain-containing protein, partial [Rhizobiaceae bacterium]
MGKILRRTFLIGTAAIAGGVAFGAYKLNQTYPNPLAGETVEGEETFNPYLKITKDNQITIMIPRAEMGQGVATTLAALVAEELDVDMAAIKVEIAPASYAYYNAAMLADSAPLAHYNRSTLASVTRSSMGGLGKILGLQVTGGSSSIADAFDKLREAGASARETLKLAAAEKSGIPLVKLRTEGGKVLLPDGKTLSYGELAEIAAKLAPPSDIKLRDASQWKILGKSTPRTDVLAKSTGAPIFGIDIDLPDMLYATLRMNPRLGGAMKSFDASAAKKLKGVIDVIDMSGPENEAFGGGFAVIATNTWAAFKGADAVKVEWDKAPYPADTESIMKVIETALDGGSGDNLRNDGDVDLSFADAPREKIVEAEYRVPYLAHATMEPMNATAQLKDGRLDIWTGTQAPTLVRSDCAYEAGTKEENTFVHSTYLGGGFGRRGEIDFPRFATRVAKATKGKPVQLIWTREEDMTHDTYRPASISR